MLIAQQAIVVTIGTVNANTASTLSIAFGAAFKPNLPIIPVLDQGDAGISAGLVFGHCRYNQTTGNIELRVGNVTTGNVTDNTAHTIWFTQVE